MLCPSHNQNLGEECAQRSFACLHLGAHCFPGSGAVAGPLRELKIYLRHQVRGSWRGKRKLFPPLRVALREQLMQRGAGGGKAHARCFCGCWQSREHTLCEPSWTMMCCIPSSACFGQLKWICVGPLAMGSLGAVLQWERGLGQEARLWSQTGSVPPVGERRLLAPAFTPLPEEASITQELYLMWLLHSQQIPWCGLGSLREVPAASNTLQRFLPVPTHQSLRISKLSCVLNLSP